MAFLQVSTENIQVLRLVGGQMGPGPRSTRLAKATAVGT